MSTNMEQNLDALFEALSIVVDSKLKNVKYYEPREWENFYEEEEQE